MATTVLADARYRCVELDRVSVSAGGRMSPAFPGRVLNFLKEGQNLCGDGVIKFGTERQWYDRSDAMTDYFDTAFYLDVEVGRFMQPYKFTKVRKLKGSTNYDQAADNAIAWNRLGAVA